MRKNLMNRSCHICGDNDFRKISQYEFGGWKDTDREVLVRDNHTYDIMSCNCCGHLMAHVKGGEKYINSLYSGPIGDEFWDIKDYDRLDPYKTMVSFCEDHMDLQLLNKIVDFGSGNGELLQVLSSEKKVENDKLLGVDFSNNMILDVPFLKADLNHLEGATEINDIKGYSLGFCCHVLEHLWEPRKFIRELKKLSSDNSWLYLEVPDHSLLNDQVILHSNLFNAQHINYFSLVSLKNMVSSCGWEVVKEQSEVFGFTPRAKLLLRATTNEIAQNNTLILFAKTQDVFKKAASKIVDLASLDVICLWGVGGDLIRLIEAEPAIEKLINNGRISLFDSELNSRKMKNGRINDFKALLEQNSKIIVCPRPARTRKNMKQLALRHGVKAERMVDIYDF